MNDVSYDHAVLSNNNTVDPSLAAKGITCNKFLVCGKCWLHDKKKNRCIA